jgi:hypothetical protein
MREDWIVQDGVEVVLKGRYCRMGRVGGRG